MMNPACERDQYLSLSDEELSAQCILDFFKATGNGGQKRNKTSSAVRLIHKPTRIAVTDSVERSQHRNRANALQKLRLAIALEFRSDSCGVLKNSCSLSAKDYPIWVAAIFDALQAGKWDPPAAAETLGWSKSHLTKMLTRDSILWQKLTDERAKRGLPFLHP